MRDTTRDTATPATATPARTAGDAATPATTTGDTATAVTTRGDAATPATMRAALFDRYGSPDVLYVGEVPVPTPTASQVLVRVEASSINGGEIASRRGDLRLLSSRRFPKRTGIDFVGTVVGAVGGVPGGTATGAEVKDGAGSATTTALTTTPSPTSPTPTTGTPTTITPTTGTSTTTTSTTITPTTTTGRLLVGSRVWGTVDKADVRGAQAEYVVVEPSRLGAAPQGLTADEAATLLAGGTTALRGIRDLAALQPGERLLVRGAAGGVGSVAVQLGKHLGAHVTGLASPSSADFVRAQGADEVVDYATPPEQLGLYDVVFDTRGTDLGAFRRRLAPRGRMVTIVPDLRRPLRSLAHLQVERLRRTRTLRIFFGDPDRRLVDDLSRLVEVGALRPVLDTVVPLDEIAAAHARLERGGVRGKLVVRVADTRS